MCVSRNDGIVGLMPFFLHFADDGQWDLDILG
jgi:hypothetical protein